MLIRLKNLTKSFSKILAVNDVSLDISRGEILGLIGANGAGKSTLVKVLKGEYQDYKGAVEIDGREIRLTTPYESSSYGISLVSQDLSLVPNLTVIENLFLGRELNGLRIPGWLDKNEMRSQGEKILQSLKVDFSPSDKLEALSRNQAQLVEIAKALLTRPSLLILDEPTTSLAPVHVEALYELIHGIVNQGATVLLVSHNLEQVLSLSHRIAVLRDGKLVFCGANEGLTVTQLRHWMYGELSNTDDKRTSSSSERKVIFEVREFSTMHFSDLNFQVNSGEIVALVTPTTESPDEVLRAIFGASPHYSGSITIQGEAMSIKSPRDAIKAGIGYLPGDRHSDGLFLNLSVVDNITILQHKKISHFGWLNRGAAQSLAENLSRQLYIRMAGFIQPIRNLSGGNQQKALLARWFLADSILLLLHEPFSGIDIQGRQDLLKILGKFRNEGKGGLFVSTEPEEIFQTCDRLILIRQGRVVRTVVTTELSAAELTAHLTGTLQ